MNHRSIDLFTTTKQGLPVHPAPFVEATEAIGVAIGHGYVASGSGGPKGRSSSKPGHSQQSSKRAAKRNVEPGLVMLDGSGGLIVRIGTEDASVVTEARPRMRIKASGGSFVEAFRILGRDPRSGTLVVKPYADMARTLPTLPLPKHVSAIYRRRRAKPVGILSDGMTTGLGTTALETRAIDPPDTALDRSSRSAAEAIAEAYLSGGDASVVVDAVRNGGGSDQRRRIAILANIMHEIVVRIDVDRSDEDLEKLAAAPVDDEFGEFRPVTLHELAKAKKNVGRDESATSYALAAVRSAMENGLQLLAGNLLAQSRRLKIL